MELPPAALGPTPAVSQPERPMQRKAGVERVPERQRGAGGADTTCRQRQSTNPVLGSRPPLLLLRLDHDGSLRTRRFARVDRSRPNRLIALFRSPKVSMRGNRSESALTPLEGATFEMGQHQLVVEVVAAAAVAKVAAGACTQRVRSARRATDTQDPRTPQANQRRGVFESQRRPPRQRGREWPRPPRLRSARPTTSAVEKTEPLGPVTPVL